MTEFVLKRVLDDHTATGGILYFEGKPYCCVLEDPFRHEKIPEVTRIPAGRYGIKLRFDSPMAKRYEEVHGTKGMIWLQDVPEFTYIYIHEGKNSNQSAGCLLVGESWQIQIRNARICMELVNSTRCYLKLHELVTRTLSEGPVFITILDN